MNRRLSRASMLLLTLLTTLGCAREPVDWAEPAPLPPALSSAPYLAFDAEQRLVTRSAPAIRPPASTNQCHGSVHVARDTTGEWYAVWWSVRSDSTAEVVVSRSTDGVAWSQPVRVDSTDAGRIGCARPPPSVDADGGNVHVAYTMTAREGPGVFTSHSMDRGLMFHSPVAVVYGERIGSTSIAARGDLVAVAYEDPNSSPTQIGLAVSRTMAHTFESRMLVSPATGPARTPAVTIGDATIAVTWTAGSDGAPTARMVRIGQLR